MNARFRIPVKPSVNRLACLATALALFVCGCGKSPPADAKSPPDSVQPPTEVDGGKQDRPPAKPPLEQREYDGEGVEWWSRRIKKIDPKGPDGAAAVDGLTALLQDSDVPYVLRLRAAVTLGAVGRPAKKAVPALMELLQSRIDALQEADDAKADRDALLALKTLEMLSGVSAPATDLLVKILQDRKQPFEHRIAALGALTSIGAADPRAVQTVVETLVRRRQLGETPHQHDQFRRLAADSMAILGPDASVGVRNLIRCTRDRDPELRRRAALALGAMRARGQDAVVPLADLMTTDSSPAVREAAAEALGMLAPHSLPALRSLLRNPDEVGNRRRAAYALGKAGPAANDEEVLDALDYSLDDRDGWVRMNAAEAIYRITGNTGSPAAAFVEELKNPDRQIRMQAYRMFKELGPKADAVRPALKRLLDDKRGYVRSAAALALRSIDSE